MSTLEEVLNNNRVADERRKLPGESLISRMLSLACSVRLGVSLLVALGLACLIGMLVMQQNVDGFDRYFAELTPAQRLVYGRLGFFDIYHAWYFNALLAVLSLNIILATVDRFPKTFLFSSSPNIVVPLRWLRSQSSAHTLVVSGDADIAREIENRFKKAGWRKTAVGQKKGITFVFGQSGLWNRFGYIFVHIALLTIFMGGFLTAQMGSTGQMPLMPGESTNLTIDTVVELDQASQITKQLPFEVTCIDVQQKLIRKEGPISVGNTIDWLTYFQIKDETGTTDGFVQMNRPFDYRGYRFFQASFSPVGRARNVTVRLIPESGSATSDVVIPRGGAVTLPDGKDLRFLEFRANFTMGREDPNEDTSDYKNPGAVLQVTEPGKSPQTAYAFGSQLASMPVAKKPVGGYMFQLVDFEKAADRHILAVQRDPGSNVVYIGFLMLFITLVGVFFFSHQRVWAAVEKNEDGNFEVTLAGHVNRSQNAFNEKLKRFVNNLRRDISGDKVS